VASHAAVAVGSQSQDQFCNGLLEEQPGKAVLCTGDEDRVSSGGCGLENGQRASWNYTHNCITIKIPLLMSEVSFAVWDALVDGQSN
jgi:hypothetical protein